MATMNNYYSGSTYYMITLRLAIYALTPSTDTTGTKDSQTTTRNPSTSTALPSHITNSPTMTTEKITGTKTNLMPHCIYNYYGATRY